MNILFGPSAKIEIILDAPARPAPRAAILAPFSTKKNEQRFIEDGVLPRSEQLVFSGNDPIRGVIRIILPPDLGGKRFEHNGIKVELVGQVEYVYDGNVTYPFTSLVRQLEAPGSLASTTEYPFEFGSVEKDHETYDGINSRLRYLVKAKISRSYAPNITKKLDFQVENYSLLPELNNSIKMEVGIEECLHIEFEYEHEHYFLDGVIVGKIHFLLVLLKIKHMELQVIRKESTGSGAQTYNDSEVVAKHEIMDGAPVRGETTPIRLFLAPMQLGPTMRNVHHKFSVRYFLNLVLIDEEERRYFKQHEIVMHRRPLEAGDSTAAGQSSE